MLVGESRPKRNGHKRYKLADFGQNPLFAALPCTFTPAPVWVPPTSRGRASIGRMQSRPPTGRCQDPGHDSSKSAVAGPQSVSLKLSASRSQSAAGGSYIERCAECVTSVMVPVSNHRSESPMAPIGTHAGYKIDHLVSSCTGKRRLSSAAVYLKQQRNTDLALSGIAVCAVMGIPVTTSTPLLDVQTVAVMFGQCYVLLLPFKAMGPLDRLLALTAPDPALAMTLQQLHSGRHKPTSLPKKMVEVLVFGSGLGTYVGDERIRKRPLVGNIPDSSPLSSSVIPSAPMPIGVYVSPRVKAHSGETSRVFFRRDVVAFAASLVFPRNKPKIRMAIVLEGGGGDACAFLYDDYPRVVHDGKDSATLHLPSVETCTWVVISEAVRRFFARKTYAQCRGLTVNVRIAMCLRKAFLGVPVALSCMEAVSRFMGVAPTVPVCTGSMATYLLCMSDCFETISVELATEGPRALHPDTEPDDVYNLRDGSEVRWRQTCCDILAVQRSGGSFYDVLQHAPSFFSGAAAPPVSPNVLWKLMEEVYPRDKSPHVLWADLASWRSTGNSVVSSALVNNSRKHSDGAGSLDNSITIGQQAALRRKIRRTSQSKSTFSLFKPRLGTKATAVAATTAQPVSASGSVLDQYALEGLLEFPN